VASGVRLVALLALSDSGRSSYEHAIAAALVGRDLQQWAAARQLT
jgi:hypothetical protein